MALSRLNGCMMALMTRSSINRYVLGTRSERMHVGCDHDDREYRDENIENIWMLILKEMLFVLSVFARKMLIKNIQHHVRVIGVCRGAKKVLL